MEQGRSPPLKRRGLVTDPTPFPARVGNHGPCKYSDNFFSYNVGNTNEFGEPLTSGITPWAEQNMYANSLFQGTGSNQRVGNDVHLERLELRFKMDIEDYPADIAPSDVRVAVLWTDSPYPMPEFLNSPGPTAQRVVFQSNDYDGFTRNYFMSGLNQYQYPNSTVLAQRVVQPPRRATLGRLGGTIVGLPYWNPNAGAGSGAVEYANATVTLDMSSFSIENAPYDEISLDLRGLRSLYPDNAIPYRDPDVPTNGILQIIAWTDRFNTTVNLSCMRLYIQSRIFYHDASNCPPECCHNKA